MPLQNRVTPFGDIVAIEQRGMFLGNRGIIHDPATRTLLTRRWTNKAWIICRCDFRGVRRKVMSRRSWTELFFLDEATALSAGHRPCYYCRRGVGAGLRGLPGHAHIGLARVSAAQIDTRLHAERLRDGVEAHSPAARHTRRTTRWRDGGVVGRCLPDGWGPGLPLERKRLRGHREFCSAPTACSRRRRPWRRCAPDLSAFCIRACPTSAIGDRQVTVCS